MHMPKALRSDRLRQYVRAGHVVLELHGEIDISAVLWIGPILDEVTAQPGIHLVIDLSPVRFIDCTGMELLCRANRRVLERRGSWRLVCPHPFVLRLMRLAGLTGRLQPMPTLTEALALQE
ncbi:STAS domain-containing protein [Streptomyces sp. VRA16 Mangrove soil]|uniref:STAS domain-containing protein n=1 Tax=Streptomyces sp. VRA16 Mangrove soil TaxID=2817434 RepID=UPI001A9E855E|nr:STAS domain-containing protein [Streptomyces sp. VRA16 Mangrove soil]MBO1330771.1 STAS domain-containing protein [Streptomyces sp. VRA16 Mangrove soil]